MKLLVFAPIDLGDRVLPSGVCEVSDAEAQSCYVRGGCRPATAAEIATALIADQPPAVETAALAHDPETAAAPRRPRGHRAATA